MLITLNKLKKNCKTFKSKTKQYANNIECLKTWITLYYSFKNENEIEMNLATYYIS